MTEEETKASATAGTVVLRCLLAGLDRVGRPSFYQLVVYVDEAGYQDGLHCDRIEEEAAKDGFESAGLVYDDRTGPAALIDAYDWDNVDWRLALS